MKSHSSHKLCAQISLSHPPPPPPTFPHPQLTTTPAGDAACPARNNAAEHDTKVGGLDQSLKIIAGRDISPPSSFSLSLFPLMPRMFPCTSDIPTGSFDASSWQRSMSRVARMAYCLYSLVSPSCSVHACGAQPSACRPGPSAWPSQLPLRLPFDELPLQPPTP